MKSLGCLRLTFLLLILLLQPLRSENKLVFIQELFRHGARYPLFANINDKSDFASRDHVLGELTTGGKNMHYLLGKKIYQTYWSQLFGGSPKQNIYNQSKFYFKSTDFNRTLESAQAHLMGIFENLPKL